LNEIVETSVKQTENSFYMSLGASVATYALYRLFFQKYRVFYNFFRKKPRYRVIPYLKVTVISFLIFSAWTQAFSSFNKHKMEEEFKKKGYFTKYKIDLDERLDAYY